MGNQPEKDYSVKDAYGVRFNEDEDLLPAPRVLTASPRSRLSFKVLVFQLAGSSGRWRIYVEVFVSRFDNTRYAAFLILLLVCVGTALFLTSKSLEVVSEISILDATQREFKSIHIGRTASGDEKAPPVNENIESEIK